MTAHEQARRRIGEAGLKRIEAATARAEAGTCGQIATCIAWQCDSYPEADWKAAALAAVTACLALFVWDLRAASWQPLGATLCVVLASAVLGAALSRLAPGLRRRLIGHERLEAMVRRRADEVFLNKELFRTERRTGILVFVSLFERRAVVVADSGVSARVPARAWDEAVARIVEAARGPGVVDGVVAALGCCRGLLLGAGFVAGPGQRNELPDRPMLDGEGA